MNLLIDVISKISPFLGSMLGGPMGGIVGTLVSKTLGGIDMSDPAKVVDAIKNDPDSERKLKELELQLKDLQDARDNANKQTGINKLMTPILALASMVAIVFDIFAIEYVQNQVVQQILIVMLIFLVWDVRQIYKFYFGSNNEDFNAFSLFKRKVK